MTPIRIQASNLDSEPYYSLVVDSIEAGETNASIARILNEAGASTSRDSIRRFRRRHGLGVVSSAPQGAKPGITITDDSGIITSAVTEGVNASSLNDPDAMLLERKLDPEQWVLKSATINEWNGPGYKGGPTKLYKQAKLNIARRQSKPLILPARSEGWKPSKRSLFDRAMARDYLKPETTIVVGDQHAPYHERPLHDAVVDWLQEHQPERGILLGDLLDFPDISRHRFDPAWAATTQECIDGAYRILLDYVAASPETEWTFCEGNHDARLRNTLIDYARDLYGLRPGIAADEIPDVAGLSLTHLLRLDELDIEYLGGEGTYEHTKVPVNSKLAAIHGDKATKGAGTSVARALEQYRHSVLQAHCHRQALIHQTTYDIEGNPGTLLGGEIGCLCQLKGGLGYSVNSDWQQGFITVVTFPDDKFHVELGTYVNGALYWRDERYA